MRPLANGSLWARYNGSKRFGDYRYTMTKLDDNHFNVLIELLTNGKYEKLSETQYVRKSRESVSRVQ